LSFFFDHRFIRSSNIIVKHCHHTAKPIWGTLQKGQVVVVVNLELM